eukprot:TRINITY_DN29871_c0_g1_i1.p1 TRINITY_DN29871_c0_g1~~TRINITY_DN29871_c0_g1_i1.p1  ORF type:complete len:652 (+),score=231.73 TRINITY_DN29871_c0_g1_i1:93-2048(+)
MPVTVAIYEDAGAARRGRTGSLDAARACASISSAAGAGDAAQEVQGCLLRMMQVHAAGAAAAGEPQNARLMADLTVARKKQVQAVPKILLSHSKLGERSVGPVADMMRECGDIANPAEFVLSYNPMATACLTRLLRPDAVAGVLVLELFACDVTDAGCGLLGSVLARNPPMQRLKLGDNKLTHAGVRRLAQGLVTNTHLVQLHLGGNAVGDAGVAHLAELKEENWFLKSIGLRECGISDVGFARLAALLSQSPQQGVAVLSLRGNAMGTTGAQALAEGMEERCGALDVLELQGCSITAGAAERLLPGLQYTRISELQLSENPLHDGGVELLCRGLLRNSHLSQRLETLGLNAVGMTGRGAEEVAGYLRGGGASTLTALSLNGNRLGAGGAAVAAAINAAAPAALRTLALNQCHITVDGSIAMARMLKANTSLTALEYQGNYSGAGGGAAWARALAENDTLAKFILTDNEVPPPAMALIQTSLELGNRSLRVFNFGGQSAGARPVANVVTSDVRQRITQAINRNKALFHARQAELQKSDGYTAPLPPPSRRTVVDHIQAGLLAWLRSQQADDADTPPPLLDLPEDDAEWVSVSSSHTSRPSTPTSPEVAPLAKPRRALADITRKNSSHAPLLSHSTEAPPKPPRVLRAVSKQ